MARRMTTLILDGRTIRRMVTFREAIGAVEEVFRAFGENKVEMPAKIYLDLKKHGGDFRAMPASIDSLNACGIKWVNVHPKNRAKGLPTVMAVYVLNDPATGFPLCVMDATYLTALRTGAAGGVAAKYLARGDSRKIALVGCGAQAKTQLRALREVFDIKEVSIWGTSHAECVKFIKKTKALKGIKVNIADTPRACVNGCDIIVTTTPSRRPLIRLAWIKKGAHINAIGADARGKQELEARILKKAKVVIDAWDQASHSGEINVPLRKGEISIRDIYADIGEVVTKRKGRSRPSEITVFDSTGLAIQDVALANLVYKKALRLKKGRRVKLVTC